MINSFSIIQEFLNSSSNKPKLICVVGPTGIGKTDLSLKIAKTFNAEIINADSKQLYKGIKGTSGQITKEEQQNIPHHLFGYVPANKNYTVSDHKKDALEKIDEILEKEKVPLLVGGTGLFINSLTQNFSLPDNSQNAELVKQLEEKSSEENWEELNTIDPAYAQITHANNRVRVIRALELFHTQGKKKSEAEKGEEIFDVLIIMPEIKDRDELYEKINKRTLLLWELAKKEASVLQTQLTKEEMYSKLPALTAIGIPEALAFFNGEISEIEAIETMQQKSRNYAKRQMTWWRGDERVQVI